MSSPSSAPSAPLSDSLQAILYTPSSSKPASLKILNQLLLPHQTVYIPITSAADAFTAIKSMAVRGAPAIAIVAALSLAVEAEGEMARLASKTSDSTSIPTEAVDVAASINGKLRYLLGSRPTAVNLAEAVGKLARVVDGAVERGADGDGVRKAYVEAAERMLVLDVQDNTAIGERGAEWIRAGHEKRRKLRVLTHCNTGSLATAGYGTALGIVRSLYGKGLLEHACYTETRPYNQGSRLTGYELLHDGIPCTLITDSMAAALMQKLHSEGDSLAAVIVGADRVALNGDTANKIGTYALAVLARFHGVKFVVAAPRTTIDLATPSGKEIVIEERPPDEMLSVKGPQVLTGSGTAIDIKNITSISTAALGTQCWNPAFDVTPAELIDAIVTEVGVAEKNDQGKFDLQHLFSISEVKQDIESGQKEMPDPKEGP